MSPMFLGGLTARAMKLRNQNVNIDFHETYPGYFIREILKAKEFYKKKEKVVNEQLIELLKIRLGLPIASPIENYHQLDAVVCWLSGKRHMQNKHLVSNNAVRKS